MGPMGPALIPIPLKQSQVAPTLPTLPAQQPQPQIQQQPQQLTSNMIRIELAAINSR